ncbi:hypothetical protein EPICR_60145 [Candidatus Desulfarcum epimagneticum]|uniref:Uncharacterized protein n=1 Tax=uncultured Desulfobacteraceae bacterium TaxID=218296 RepID=A0A484HQK1_9BACT|nr:hypothetical protein EPICR_60145 [uncultured Desulfobacteraceae bacterium]
MRQGFQRIATASDHLTGKLEEFSILDGMGIVGPDCHHPVIAHDNHIVVTHGHYHSISEFLRAWEEIGNSRHVSDIEWDLWDHEIVGVVRLATG